MPCHKPWKARRDSVRGVAPAGPLEPFFWMDCDRCLGCRLRRSTDWALRCMHEAQFHDQNSFLTLTYNDRHLPKDGCLRPEDMTKFFKRLRRYLDGWTKVRYLYCGEYGEQNGRPHYHAILFGEDFRHDRKFWKRTSGGALFVSPSLSDLWRCVRCGDSLGYATLGSVSFQSAAYTARYALKVDKSDAGFDKYPIATDVLSGEVRPSVPFARMSRNPGLGRSYFDRYKHEMLAHDSVVYAGKEFPLPRYYDYLLRQEEPEAFEKLLAKRTAVAIARAKQEGRPYDEVASVAGEIAEAKGRFAGLHKEFV